MTPMPLVAHIEGISVLGPGLADWSMAHSVFAGRIGYAGEPAILPMPTGLPAAERRRTTYVGNVP